MEQHPNNVANKSVLYYNRGWYYLSVAKVHHDGSVGIISHPRPHRARELVQMAETLKARTP